MDDEIIDNADIICPHCRKTIELEKTDLEKGKFICPWCDMQVNLDSKSNAIIVPDKKVLKNRKSWIALLLSILLPGLGHLYSGRMVRGSVLFVAMIIVFNLAFAIFVFTDNRLLSVFWTSPATTDMELSWFCHPLEFKRTFTA